MNHLFRYQGWGLDMIVPMWVPELAESQSTAAPDWELRTGPVPSIDRDTLRFTLPNGAPVAIMGEKSAYVANDRSASGMHPSLLRSVLAPVLRLRGNIVLHGSAIEWNGRTLVLVGPSGSGKTTLAATVCAMGGRLLTDELCAVVWNGNCPMVLPGSRLLALHPEALRLTGLMEPSALSQRQDEILIRNGRVLTSVPLQEERRKVDMLCLLAWSQSTEPNITPVTAAARFDLLASARYQPGVGPHAANATELPQIGKLLSKCPIVRLERSLATSPIESADMLKNMAYSRW